jgi:hypothetical protein
VCPAPIPRLAHLALFLHIRSSFSIQYVITVSDDLTCWPDIHSAILQGLLSSLEDRQRACRLYIDRIGDILSAQLPNVYIYKVCLGFPEAVVILLTHCLQEYCMNQSQAISRLQALREQDGKVAAHLQVSLPSVSGSERQTEY